ncbi:DNA topoisomerase (ATP-hydrolyzing) subunit B [Candidatus Micrarchaeota archaeon]|nr:DNA topoisomerase (ATP-hydrolyzing) subunit B [Candidatus Micrarchaeota archaeon]
MVEELDYSAADIQILEGLEGVRRRPSMYIGDTGKRGLHHLIYEVTDNSIDEAMAGFCKNIEIILKPDGSVSVRDDGRGIPTEIHKATGKSALEIVTTVLHAGGKFEKKAYQVSGGLHGVGISVVNALSEWMEAEIHRGGKTYFQRYSRGIPEKSVGITGDTEYRGTIIRFKPDQSIFQTLEFDYDYLSERLRELAFLNKGVRILLRDERTDEPKETEFFYEGGLSQFVEYLNRAKNRLHQPFVFEKESSGVSMEYAVQYTDAYSGNVYSFVNNIKTIEGGTHVTGFKSALTRSINDYIKNEKISKRKAGGDDVLEGLTAVISIKIADPQFEGQTKTKLGNSDVKGIVDSLVYESLKTYFGENPNIAKTIIQKVLSAIEAREAAQKAKEVIRRKTVFETSILPGKLADCSEIDPQKTELFIVEGDSAGGSCKQGRDRKFQAILPLRGKILNVEKAPIHKVFKSDTIKSTILSLGCGVGDDFDINKIRYHKVIIATDADVDGSHIRTLLLTLFYRYFKQIIEAGYLYVAQPPLYKIKKGKTEKYAYNDAQLKEVIAELGDPVSIQRYKGLGEMNPEQLWTTTMDPETRTLKKVTIEDAMQADELFTILMGSDVGPRREFIEKYAAQVKNLDV